MAQFDIKIGNFSWKEFVSASVETEAWQQVISVIEKLILTDTELTQRGDLIIRIDCSEGADFASRISGLPWAQFKILSSNCQGLLLWEFIIRNFNVIAERAVRRNGVTTTGFREIGRATYYAYPARQEGFWLEAICHAADFAVAFKAEREKKRLVLPDRVIIVNPFRRAVLGLLGRYFADVPSQELFKDFEPARHGSYYQISPADESE
ncbi:MAG TPA: hypothetical protein VN420_04210 [Candidatus Fimivivens sp.]|nr:hypothetical protein [Candidatus Fimivivens sp.]